MGESCTRQRAVSLQAPAWLVLILLLWGAAVPAWSGGLDHAAPTAGTPEPGLVTGESLSSGAAARALLQERLSAIEHFVADVSQEVQGARGELLERSVGALIIARPHFRWTVEDPYPQVIVSDGALLTVFDPDLNQAVVRDVAAALVDTPIALLTQDRVELAEDFDILLLADGAEEVFLLTPRSEDTLYSEIRLRFLDRTLQGLGIVDHLGQYTDIRFQNVQYPADIDAGEFVLQLTPDVDIVRG